jgi:hypothetical protein
MVGRSSKAAQSKGVMDETRWHEAAQSKGVMAETRWHEAAQSKGVMAETRWHAMVLLLHTMCSAQTANEEMQGRRNANSKKG